jgi:hypothetical protein
MLLFVNTREESRKAEAVFQAFADSTDPNDCLFFILRITDSTFWTTLEAMSSKS